MPLASARGISPLFFPLLASVLLGSLNAGAALASSPLGVIVQAAKANREIDPKTDGTTVYDGDSLPLEGDSYVVVQLGKSRILLEPFPQGTKPQMVLHRLLNGFSAHLASGALEIAAAAGDKFEVIADGILIEPVRGVPSSIKIVLGTNRELDVESVRGSAHLSMGGQVAITKEGYSYRVDLLPDVSTNAASGNLKPPAPGRNWFTVTMIAAISIGTVIAVWRALVSPCHP